MNMNTSKMTNVMYSCLIVGESKCDFDKVCTPHKAIQES